MVFGFIAKKPKTLLKPRFYLFFNKLVIQEYYKKKIYKPRKHQIAKFQNSEIFHSRRPGLTKAHNKSRIYETISSCIQQGNGKGEIRNQNGKTLLNLYEGLRSPKTGREYKEFTPSAFSFNSPIGHVQIVRASGV